MRDRTSKKYSNTVHYQVTTLVLVFHTHVSLSPSSTIWKG